MNKVYIKEMGLPGFLTSHVKEYDCDSVSYNNGFVIMFGVVEQPGGNPNESIPELAIPAHKIEWIQRFRSE